MEHIKAKSSNIYSHAHDGTNAEFKFSCMKCAGNGCDKCKGNGYTSHYEYSGVPSEVYRKVAESHSVGAAFATLIKGQYEYRKL